MTDWHRLFEKYQHVADHKAERQRQLDAAATAQKEFEAWSVRTIPRLYAELAVIAGARADELSKEVGVKVEVSIGPNSAPDVHQPWLGYLKLALGDVRVYLYAAPTPQTYVYLHLLANHHDLRERVVTRQGAVLKRAAGDGYELGYLDGDPAGVAHTQMPLDALVYRAFEQMADAQAPLLTPASSP